ncbi:MAG: glucose-6-phosphate isomerase [Clostridioides sp.]|nr:glucose-6-phosphate isomerase [Clostridioides sp.]
MKNIKFDYKNSFDFLNEDDLKKYDEKIKEVHNMLHNKTGKGKEFLGWLNLPSNFDKDEFDRIKICSEKIKSDSEILLVIGVGGSYLGARAAINMLGSTFQECIDNKSNKNTKIYFAGNNLSTNYICDLIELIGERDFSINVISKSGTTTEPAIAFRIFREILEKKYGKENASKRIYVTTDKEKGALKNMSDKEGYETFVIPDDVGGRYSVLTAVGLLPICVAGYNIDDIMNGANDAMLRLNNDDIFENESYQYAICRNIFYKLGKSVELFATYEPKLNFFCEWCKQLFGESEGKEGKGIFPAAATYSTELHSIGQYIQEGKRIMFETVFEIEDICKKLVIPYDEDNLDGLNYLDGKDVEFVNKKSLQGTVVAHTDGGVPNLIIKIPEINEYYFGYLVYFFEKACAMSGYLLGVNPFDQPGVEEYKKNMFALSNKPGYEDRKEEIEKKIYRK